MTSSSTSVPSSSQSLPFSGTHSPFNYSGGNTESRVSSHTAAPSSASPSAAAAAAASAVTSPITAFSRLCFLDSLSSLVGRKLLLLDETLAGSLSLLVDTATLQQHGVDRCYPLRAFPLPASSLSSGAQSAPFVIFVCRPRLLLLPLIAQHIHFIERTYQPTQPPSLSTPPSSGVSFPAPCSFSPSGRHFFVLFVPSSSDFLSSELRRLLSNPPSLSSTSPSSRPSSSLISNLSSLPAALTSTILFNGGPSGSPAPPFDSTSSPVQLNLDSTTIAGCPLYFFPLAPDVLSLELPNAFRDIHVHGDPSPCLHAAAAIQLLQQELQSNTVVPHLRCLGSAAKTVADHLIQQRKEKQAAEQQQMHWGEATCSSNGLWATGARAVGDRTSSPEGVPDALHQFVPVAPPVRFVLSKEDVEPGGSEPTLRPSPEERDSRGGAGLSQGTQRAREDTGGAGERKMIRGGGGSGAAGSPEGGALAEGRYMQNGILECGRRGARCEAGETTPAVKVDMLVLIDRRSDLITPLCSAFTYEALLDIVFGIESAALEVPQQLLQQQSSSGGGAPSTASQPGKAVPVLLPGGRKQKVPLSSDGLFATLRDLHQSAVGSHLHRIASEIQQTYKEKDELRSIQEISVFMNKFKIKQQEHSSLSLHVRLASFLASVTKDPAFFKRLTLEDELLQSAGSGSGASASGGGTLTASMMSQLENMIDATAISGDLWWVPSPSGDGGGAGTVGRLSGHPGKPVAAPCVEDVYRLLCLASLLNGGLKGKQLEGLKRGLVQQHGLKEVVRMAHLQQVGLLRQADGGGASSSGGAGKGVCGVGSWKTLKKECRLMVDEELSSGDIAYACSGYAPLSVRLIQFLHEFPNGWRSIPHVLSLLWGPALEVRQQQPQPPLAVLQLQQQQKLLQQQQREAESASTERAMDPKQMTTIMVMYLGGVTYAEIAAIRRLNELEIERYQRYVKEQEQLLQQGGGGSLKPPTRRRYVIVTTDVINYKKLLSGCGEEPEDICERFEWRNRDA
ncbi:sec1 family domain-containing [Cystoisospora suis]|uniref:Sec1 family domain-containing n=1 Tax=Cystoisospora suis TaxID=483139 RepID=A0A2C6KGZ2_9APIC|nr:sec1 family domain-containing [Cystoisospora suis]